MRKITKTAWLKSGLITALGVTTALTGSVAANAETLKEALAAAYLSNPQLEAQRAALRATDEDVRRAKANYFPRVSTNLSGSEGENRNNLRTAFGPNPDFDPNLPVSDNNPEQIPIGQENNPDAIFTPTDSRNFDVTVDQNIFRGFRTHNEIQQAKSSVFAGRAQLTLVEQTVLLDGVTAYMDVVRDEAVTELNLNNVQVLERQLQASRDRFRVGEITRTDVAQSEARLEGARAQLLSAQATLAASRATFERVVGRAPATLQNPEDSPALPQDIEGAIELGRVEAPQILQARHNEQAAKEGIDVAKGQLLPTVTARYQYRDGQGTQFFGSFQNVADNNSQTVSVQVSIPLYSGGANYSDIRRAKQVRSQRMLQIQQAERETQERVLTAWNQYKAAQAQILSRQAAVRANEIALDGVRQEAQVGSRTTLDVLDAEQELLDSRVNLVRAERDETVASYTLLSSMGQLTAQKLGLGVELYDPNENYKKVRTQIIGW